MTRPTRARLFLPRPALGGCIFIAIERDTRGAILSDAQRFNYFPATPMGMLSWIFTGTLHMTDIPSDPAAVPHLGPALPRLVFSGPQRQPMASWSPGPVHALSIAFYPDALARLLGRPVEPFIDRVLPAQAVLGPEMLAACEAVFAQDPDGAVFPGIEDRLHPFWAGGHVGSPAPLVGGWVRSLATRAAFSKPGCGMRQVQRRIKSWAGQSHRDLQVFARVEEAFVQAAAHRQPAGLDLAGLAASAGFADQSHMGRAVRRVTGMPPGRFDHRIAHDEAFWFYRLIESHLRRV